MKTTVKCRKPWEISSRSPTPHTRLETEQETENTPNTGKTSVSPPQTELKSGSVLRNLFLVNLIFFIFNHASSVSLSLCYFGMTSPKIFKCKHRFSIQYNTFTLSFPESPPKKPRGRDFLKVALFYKTRSTLNTLYVYVCLTITFCWKKSMDYLTFHFTQMLQKRNILRRRAKVANTHLISTYTWLFKQS